MRARLQLAGALLLALLGLGIALGRGVFGAHEGPGEIAGKALPQEAVAARASAQRAATEKLAAQLASAAGSLPNAARAPEAEELGGPAGGAVEAAPPTPEKSILFGDLHVHTSVSLDAFLMSLPLAGGEGAHPAADACDFARYCSALDFWSLNDHAESLTPEVWRESVASVRECNAVAGSSDDPDVVSYLGWEWTQVGDTAETHFGHRNVILRDLTDDAIPARPIAASGSRVGKLVGSLPVRAALVSANLGDARVHGFARHITELQDAERCPEGVPTRDLPRDCMESAATPNELLAKLSDWGSAALVIPHGSAWGFTAPSLASWETQLGEGVHNANLQRLIEVYSGHGSSEEYRPWRPLVRGANGEPVCPPPSPDYMPTCWRAGEIIERRCLAQGERAEECAERAADARTQAANVAGRANERVVPLASGDEWGDAGQCRDCFLPAFQLRPLLSVQHLLALTSFANPEKPWRYRLGFIAASDSHSARPGAGYKEFARRQMVDGQTDRATRRKWNPSRRPPARAERASRVRDGGLGGRLRDGPPDDRIGSMLFTGGLVAVHATSRARGAIWDALERREVYGTSGQRTLLWFDLVNTPDGALHPMGSEARMGFAPRFRVRAIGSQKQRPGCPAFAASGLPGERLARLCRGECFNPSDERHRITRIEVVRIRPQQVPGEAVDDLISDPWRTFECAPSQAGCEVEFADDEFAVRARDAVYYVRAIEEPTPAVNGKGLGCTRDAKGDCSAIDATPSGPDDDRLSDVEERAWSSPIFVDYAANESDATSSSAAAQADVTRGSSPPAEAPFVPVPHGELDPAWSEPPEER
jgi:hypothetical protein